MFDIERVQENTGKIKEQETKIESRFVKSYVAEYVERVEPGQILLIRPSE